MKLLQFIFFSLYFIQGVLAQKGGPSNLPPPKYWQDLTMMANTVNADNFQEYEKKIVLLEKKHPGDIEIQFAKIQFYANAGKIDTASILLDGVPQPTLIDTLTWLYYKQRLLVLQEKFEEARFYLDKRAVYDDESLGYIQNKALYYLFADSLPAALYYYNQFLLRSQSDKFSDPGPLSDSYYYRGILNGRLGYTDRAISDLSTALSLINPSLRYQVYLARAVCYLQNKDIKNAVIDLRLALKSDPDTITMCIAWAYLQENERSAEFLPAILNMQTANARAEREKYYWLACIYSVRNEPEKALEYLEKCLSLGYAKFKWIEADYDLTNIRKLPAYAQIIKKYQPAQ